MTDKQAPDLEALAGAAEDASAASDPVNHKCVCPSCGSTRSKYGVLGIKHHTFIPEGKIMDFGYRARGAVCLDCGHLRHYLNADDVKKIREDA
jgi:hypothetical protein